MLDAVASDPVSLGWMVGSPPPLDKLIRFADGSFRSFPQTRWAFANMRQFVQTSAVSRGDGTISEIPRAELAGIDDITFQPIGGSERVTWSQSLRANYTDGIVVLHKGRIAYQRYFGVLKPYGQHIAFSVTKSFVGTLAASLVAEGALNANATVTAYVPELQDSGFGDATVRQLLDMTTSIRFSEEYTDPKSEVFEQSRAGGVLPRPADYQGPETFYEFLRTVRKESEHGVRFAYKTANSDVLAWVVRRVTGKPFGELLRERLWSRVGMEHDGYFSVDTAGTEFAGGGLNASLRDLARFGELMLRNGCYNAQQIVPASVVDDIRRGGNREHFAKAGYKMLPGWSYRNMWWVSHNAHGAYTARGIHGQAIYIDPTADMVVARFASHPMAANAHFDGTSLPAYHALALYLMATRP